MDEEIDVYSASSNNGLPVLATDRHSEVLSRNEEWAELAVDIY